MRLFVSIWLPDTLRLEIVNQREEIKRACFTREHSQRMRWGNEREYHVTQYFVGEVDPNNLERLKETMRRVATVTKAFVLETDRFEFKPRKNPRLLWLRFRPNETFANLTGEIHRALVTEKLTDAEQPSEPTPHVTLVRLKQVKPIGLESPEPKRATVTVDKIYLMQSFRKQTGSEYKTLESFDLTGPGLTKAYAD